MSHNAENRKRAVQLITRRNVLERRIRQTQKQLAAQGSGARQALEKTLLADQAALSKTIPTLEALKADFRREEEEHIRRFRDKTQEALRGKEDWRNSQLLHSQFRRSFPGSIPPSSGQAMGLLLVLAASIAIVSAALLLNR